MHESIPIPIPIPIHPYLPYRHAIILSIMRFNECFVLSSEVFIETSQ